MRTFVYRQTIDISTDVYSSENRVQKRTNEIYKQAFNAQTYPH
jgi:hypothetical protein